ncbi:MAG: hypothetical protein ACRERE_31970 [Candidatus Entotheonellia bacterium]
MIHFNGPAVSSNARDAMGLPVQLVGDKEHGSIRKVRLTVVDDSSLLPKVMDPMCSAITVVGFSFTFVGDRRFMKDRWIALRESLMMLRLQLRIEGR